MAFAPANSPFKLAGSSPVCSASPPKAAFEAVGGVAGAPFGASPIPMPSKLSDSPDRGGSSIAVILQQLARDSEETRVAIGRAGGISTLLQQLNGCPEAQLSVLQAILTVVQGSAENQSKLVNAGGVNIFLDILNSGSASGDVSSTVLRILAVLVKNDPNHGKPLVHFGGIPILIRTAEKGSEDSCRYAVYLLRHLALISDEFRFAITEEGCIPTLVRLLDEGGNEVRGWAAGVLQVLIEGNRQNQAEAVNHGAIPPLMRLGASGSADEARRATAVIAVLALNSAQAQEILINEGGVQVLLHLKERGFQNAAIALKQLSVPSTALHGVAFWGGQSTVAGGA